MESDTSPAPWWRIAAKACVSFVVSVCLGAIAQGLISGRQALIVNLIIGALTTAGVWKVTNASNSG